MPRQLHSLWNRLLGKGHRQSERLEQIQPSYCADMTDPPPYSERDFPQPIACLTAINHFRSIAAAASPDTETKAITKAVWRIVLVTAEYVSNRAPETALMAAHTISVAIANAAYASADSRCGKPWFSHDVWSENAFSILQATD